MPDTIDHEQNKGGPIAVVGVGASAGGLEAFRTLLKALPPTSGFAYVLIQHLDPTHESMMVDLLARHTKMPVAQATDGQRVEADHVYVIPPNSYLTTRNGQLQVKAPTEPRGARMAIDAFFNSLAEDQQERAIGIVLTGTGSDGTSGLRAIKTGGGLSIAQDPATAPHDGMPRSAIQAGVVDVTLPVEEIPDALTRFAAHPYLSGADGSQGQVPAIKTGVTAILNLIRVRRGADFRVYKRSTIERRIQRRMGLNHIQDPADYLEFLRANDAEVESLEQDMMIGVTRFFRDQTAFDYLDGNVLAPLVQRADTAVRVWIAGCSTGEEAYSIAMLLNEQRLSLNSAIELQLFASDVDKDSLETARSGIYSGSVVSDVPESLRSRYFRALEDDRFQIKGELRDSVVFAHQNIISDPPFSKMDLISCRNLLIYLEPEVQRRVISLFHFALNESGYLFLGSSEGVTHEPALFDTISKRERIYRRLTSTVRYRPELVFSDDDYPPSSTDANTKSRRPGKRVAELATREIIREFGPPTVIVNKNYDVVFTSGDTDQYLVVPTGEPSQDLLGMLRDGLKTRVRAALHKAKRDKDVVTASSVRLRRDGAYHRTDVQVRPIGEPDNPDALFMVSFSQTAEISDVGEQPSAEHEPSDSTIATLEAELSRTRDDLNSTIEELETSNEELRASNEEGMSINEELQSTNEELETSKEELQSLNEELSTVNSQLQDKVLDLQEANHDITNLLHSTEIATIFLDTRLQIRRFTPAIASLLTLIDSDVGRPLADIAQKFSDPDLLDDAQRVMRTQVAIEDRQIEADDGRLFIRRISPYRTDGQYASGVVITFTDVSTLTESQALAKERLAQLQSISEHSPVGLALFSSKRKLIHINSELAAIADSPIEKLNGQRANEFMGDIGEAFDQKLRDVLRSKTRVDGVELAGASSSSPGIARQWSASFYPILNDEGEVTSIATVIHETTHEARATKILEASREANLNLGDDDIEQALIEKSLRIFADRVDVDVAEFWRPVNGELECVQFLAPGISGTDAEVKKELDDIRLAAGEGLTGKVWLEQQPRWWHVGGPSVEFVRRERARRLGLKTAFAAPVGKGEQQTGVVAFFSRSTMTADDAVLNALGSFAGELNQHIRRVRIQEKLIESDQQKEDFLSLLGHELRNPLSALGNTVELMRVSPQDNSTSVEKLQHYIGTMGRLLDDLLDFGRISRGKLALKEEPTDLVSLLRAAYENAKPDFDANGVTLALEVPDGSLVQLVDPVRVDQVLSNLLSNALKFTPESGRVTLSLSHSADGVAIKVTDTGEGMDPDDLERIFQPFEQANFRGDQNLGLGIGLSLVRQLVELHGGDIGAFSAGAGEGATFAVRLPDRPAELLPHAPHQVENYGPTGESRVRVLLVDDNLDAAEALSALLEVWGFDVSVARDVASGIRLAKTCEPDLLIADIGLPDGSGFDVIDTVSSSDVCSVVLSGYGDEKTLQRSEEAGVERHFVKPLDFGLLRTFLDERFSPVDRSS